MKLTAHLNFKRPTLVFFGDTYSSNWHAQWNGQTIPIMSTDAIFMAVAVPSKSGILTLTFSPSLFLNLVKVSFILSIIMALLIIYTLSTKLVRGSRWNLSKEAP